MKINSEISAATAAVVMRMVDAKHKEIKGDGDGDGDGGGGGFSCQFPTKTKEKLQNSMRTKKFVVRKKQIEMRNDDR